MRRSDLAREFALIIDELKLLEADLTASLFAEVLLEHLGTNIESLPGDLVQAVTQVAQDWDCSVRVAQAALYAFGRQFPAEEFDFRPFKSKN